MICLILAVTASALVSVIMRISRQYVRNNISMLASNYIMCTALAAAFSGPGHLIPAAQKGFLFCLLFGLVSGFLYLLSFILLQTNINRNGVILSSVFMKLGVMVPTLMSVILFHEQPHVLQVAGFVLAVASMIFFNMENGSGKTSGGLLLILLLLVSGFTDGSSKIYEELGPSGLKNHYLLYTFFAAFLFSVAVCLVRKQKLTWQDACFGLLIGVPNYFSARFLLLSLAEVPAVIAYPTYSVATIAVVALFGVFLFGERLSGRRIAAVLAIIGALVLLNI